MFLSPHDRLRVNLVIEALEADFGVTKAQAMTARGHLQKRLDRYGPRNAKKVLSRNVSEIAEALGVELRAKGLL